MQIPDNPGRFPIILNDQKPEQIANAELLWSSLPLLKNRIMEFSRFPFPLASSFHMHLLNKLDQIDEVI
ncbi:MAG TPA: hypothetical protein DCY03_11720 [Planctomycetaceae bacterium]|nr:hypothetical protein [Planctomycetaceae bacterium]|tara:strand:- start:14552 stop:14758 length:207 start_codon:yes stop_codon:yes gene_type:complete